MNAVGFNQKVDVELVRSALRNEPFPSGAPIQFSGVFRMEHIRNGKVIGVQEFPNGVTNIGKSHNLGVVFAGGTQKATWYLGLISSPVSGGPAATDTMASHPGWIEFTAYKLQDTTTVNRPTWGPVAPADGVTSIKNTAAAQFVINTGGGTLQVYGIFCTDEAPKGGNGSGKILWATAPFTSPIDVAQDDVLKLTYTVNVA